MTQFLQKETLLTSPELLATVKQLVDGEDITAAQREALRAIVRVEQRPTITWRSPQPGLHVIDGQHVDSDLLGLMAAHLAFSNPWRKVVRAADIAAPGAACADDVVRKALRAAAKFIAPLSARAAAAVRSVRVLDGFVYYAPDGVRDIDAS